MDPSIFGFIIPLVLAGIFYMCGVFADKKKDHLKLIAARDSYQLYETASLIQNIWNDETKFGICGKCGMDDAPVIQFHSGSRKCKWCAERDNLTYHLEHNGVRRLLPSKRKSAA